MGKGSGNTRRVLCILAVTASLTTFVGVVPAQAAITVDGPAETSLFGQIDTYRGNNGKGTLTLHNFILALAEGHSRAMAKRNLLSHFGFARRVSRIYANDAGIKNQFLCENVAFVRNPAINSLGAATAIFNGWQASQPHNKCMLDINRNSVTTQSAAVGVVRRGSTWWATFITAHDTTP
jgi:uncharacterized protein YkwD